MESRPIILSQPGEFEYEEKRSKFIGYCEPVTTEDDARAVISRVRAIHSKANHNVFAYATRQGNITRMSDDGEPNGTAGMPVLNLFQKSGVVDYVCVVTRYFGGTLLGTGGLVRAYSRAAKGAMEAARPMEEIIYTIRSVKCHYNQFDKLKYDLGKAEIEIMGTEYTNHCLLTVRLRDDQEDIFATLTPFEK